MRLCCELLANLVYQASVREADGRMVVVLENEETLLPEDARYGDFCIVEATEQERERLREAGYAMPDWDPARSQAGPPSPGGNPT